MKDQGKRILIVDDCDDIRANLRDILEDQGYRADDAHDGPSALHLVRERSYDLALLDYKMPGMDGATLYKNIRMIRPEVPAIMITAYAGNSGAEQALDAGTLQVLGKPVDIASLLPMVEKTCGRG